MIGLIIKILASLGMVSFTAYQFSIGNWGWGIFLIFLCAIPPLLIFRNENILLAFNQIRLQNMDKAIKHLSRIKQPQYLIKSQRAYYYYLLGLTGSQSAGMGETEKRFRKALEIGLRSDQDKAIAKMNIGAICMGSGRKREAQNLLNEAKKLDKNGILGEQIKMLKQQMGRVTSKNQMRMAQMNKGKGPGKAIKGRFK